MELLGLLGRAVLVFGLLGATLWAVRRVDRGRTRTRAGTPLQLVASARLGKGASVALVRIGDTAYALGVTEHTVSLLTPAEVPEPPPPADTDSRPGFAGALSEQLSLLAAGAGFRPPTPRRHEQVPSGT